MKVILFGATGMVGRAVLLECLADDAVTSVLAVVRRPSDDTHDKLTELIHADFTTYDDVTEQITGYDACFYCLGISSAGMSEAEYSHVTYDFTVAAGEALAKANPGMTMCFLSGQATDSSEQGRVMWARIKGKAENAVLALPFGAAYVFRPGFIQPMKGVTSRTLLYRAAYVLSGPLYPLLKRMAPGSVTTSVNMGLAMIEAAQNGAPKQHLENADINELAAKRAGGTP